MKCLHSITALGSVFICMSASAQHSLPQLDQAALQALLQKDSIKQSLADLKFADARRFELFRNLGFEDGQICVSPQPIAAADIDMHRSLFVHDIATLSAGNFTLRRTLQKLADDVSGSVAITPEEIFQQFWDTQNDTANQVTAGDIHCDDNDGKINGFPLNKCPRPEGIEARPPLADVSDTIDDDYKAIGLVNRVDLAHEGWRNCGEHRIVYGKKVHASPEKNFIIFEAVLPNPKPGCRSGCREVIEFWVDLSSDSDPASRASKLESFFYNGLAGFRPVVHTQHYSAKGVSGYGGSGSGQVRTNQFLNRQGMGLGPWTLKEFKTVLSCAGGSCDYDLVPISVKGNPYGVLWNRDVAMGGLPFPPPSNPYATPIANLDALALDFQSDVLAQVTVDKLGESDPNSITYEVDLDKNAAESQSGTPRTIDDYRNQYNISVADDFRTDLDTAAGGFALTGDQVVNRAIALSCAGCHLPNGFGLTSPNSIGPGQNWPAALSFVHNDIETRVFNNVPSFNPVHFNNDPTVFDISPALLGNFLPARRNNLVDLANEDVCNCQRKELRLDFTASVMAEFNEALTALREDVLSNLNEEKTRLVGLEELTSSNVLESFQRQKRILMAADASEIRLLEKFGIQTERVSVETVPDLVIQKRIGVKELHKIRHELLAEILNAEPSRRTVNGSFRVH